MRKPKNVTIKVLASALDLSPQAVSQALNDYEGTVRVSAETRERVRSLAARWNYRPHAGARALRRQTHRNLGFIEVKPPPNSHFLYLISAGVFDAAEENGYQVTFVRMFDGGTEPQRIPKALREIQLDAAIVACSGPRSPDLDQLFATLNIPIVYVNSRKPANAVYPDNRGGGREMTRHLIETGFRNIAFLHAPAEAPDDITIDRRAGYEAAMLADGLPPRVIDIGSDALPQSVWARQPLTDEERRLLPDAFVCSDDFTALHLFNMLYAAGVRVPDDVAIAGFGDNVYASVSAVPLTTAHIPYRDMGRAAVAMALDMIKHQNPSAQMPPVCLPVALRVRTSTSRPNPKA
ncbi:MAG TPA: LacI family DNA-binding transcriptional regulator [Verrucomicrobiae bacterium]|nr:LacI family DNA-binding transcriptional regulator [Verrucomicrobiae bacterium]